MVDIDQSLFGEDAIVLYTLFCLREQEAPGRIKSESLGAEESVCFLALL